MSFASFVLLIFTVITLKAVKRCTLVWLNAGYFSCLNHNLIFLCSFSLSFAHFYSLSHIVYTVYYCNPLDVRVFIVLYALFYDLLCMSCVFMTTFFLRFENLNLCLNFILFFLYCLAPAPRTLLKKKNQKNEILYTVY